VRDGTIDLSTAIDRRAVAGAVRKDADFIDATGIATALMGDSIAGNLFLLGFAWQRGLVPLGFEALDRAIELNGVAVEMNRKAFAWGRLAAHDLKAIEAVVAPPPVDASSAPFDLAAFMRARAEDLTQYQNAAYAERYRRLVQMAETAECPIAGHTGEFAEAVARNFYKLMAYKDEYEVGRLYADGRFAAQLAEQFDGDYKLEFSLAPPLIAKRDSVSGHLRKRVYGSWMMAGFRLLAMLKRLRGGPFDVFGYQAERRIERALIVEYEETIRDLAARLASTNHDVATAVARLPERIRGYGHVKAANIAKVKQDLPGLLAQLDQTQPLIAVGE
jgi:indolepyruvate ferredoxin oxidoreductase